MNGTIKQIWDGTLCASKDFHWAKSSHEAYFKLKMYIDHLQQVLPEAQHRDLDNLIRCCEALENAAVEEAFALGYKTGAQITAEAMLHK
ncbi:MAG: hypothetical protein IJY20_03640 [Clostridia bacterium]|nr:hypothetical protein [Clostridia bacterium]